MSRQLLAILVVLLGPTAATAIAAERPNVVFILLDDMGWGDLHCYGHPYSQTPNIDKLASEGTRFQQCYATGVTCCPSRTGFMTSRFPATYAKYPANGGFSGQVTVTELLKQHGYATGHFGKWHIGPVTTAGTYGIDVIGDDERARRNQATARCRDAHIFDGAVSFIEQHRGEPFYVNVWCHIPHHPIDPAPAVLDRFGPLAIETAKFPPTMQEKLALCQRLGGDINQHMRAYLAELKAVDEEVGALLRRLDELKLSEKTIVALSSDQGAAPLRDPAEFDTAPKKSKFSDVDVRRNALGFNGPLRGGKHNQYEGGVRIPLIVRWPGHVPAARVDKESVISGADWLPTLCSLTGAKVTASGLDGEDVSAAWLGKATHMRGKPLFWKTSSVNSDPAIRDGNWKLHGSHRKKGEVELYDIAADPGEQDNLAAQRPDIVRALSAKLAAWQATLPKSYDKSDDGDK